MNVLTYWCMNVLTYEHLNVWMYIRMNIWLNELMSRWMSCLMDEWQEKLPFECLADLPISQMIDRLTYHLNDCPYLPTLTLKNGRITANQRTSDPKFRSDTIKTVGLCLFSVGWTWKHPSKPTTFNCPFFIHFNKKPTQISKLLFLWLIRWQQVLKVIIYDLSASAIFSCILQ